MDTLDTMRILPKELLARLQAIFDRLSGAGGRLDARGLKTALDTIGAHYTDSDVMDLVIEIDPRTKSLDFTDFISVMTRPLDDNVQQDLEDVYALLDRWTLPQLLSPALLLPELCSPLLKPLPCL